MSRPAVIYHADCPDGMSGGWSAWKKFGSRADYFPSHHQNPLPKGLSGRMVYVIDFSYPPSLMKRLVADANRVVAIDHHGMALPSAKLAHEMSFDLHRSGAVLSWEYFHPGKPLPALLRYVQDVDLWRFSLPKSREVSVLTSLVPHEFRAWDRMVKTFEKPKTRKTLIARAEAMLEYEQALLRRVLAKAVKVAWRGQTHYAVNSPVFPSELGHELAMRSRSKIGIVWHRSPEGIKISLRSEGNVDVAKIAMEYGGGGHRNAAAFRIKKGDKLPWRF